MVMISTKFEVDMITHSIIAVDTLHDLDL